MTLRRRVGMAAAIAVAVAVVLVAAISYFVVRSQLVGQIDNDLRAQANLIEARAGLGRRFPTPPASVGGPAPYVWIVLPNQQLYPQQLGDISLSPTPRMAEVAAGGSGPYINSMWIGSSHLRMLVFQAPGPLGAGQSVAIVLARPLSSVDHIL